MTSGRYKKVEPCSCGSSDLELAEALLDKEMVSIVSCRTCRASGPPHDTRPMAVIGWNARQRHKRKMDARNEEMEKKHYVN